MDDRYRVNSTTGSAPPGGAVNSTDVAYRPVRERVETWFIDPLRRLGDHDAFPCMMICLPLLERTIRFMEEADDGDKFTEGSKLVKRLAYLLGISPAGASEFWQVFRNGILHRSMPKPTPGRRYELGGGRPVVVSGDTMTVNPWALRDLVIQLVGENRKIWDDPSYPLAAVYVKQ